MTSGSLRSSLACFVCALAGSTLIIGCGTGGAGPSDPQGPANPHVDDKTTPPSSPSMTDQAEYLVTVRTETWDEPNGMLARWRRAADGWERDGADFPIVLGRSGLGWGRGLHGEGAVARVGGPEKAEGDGRSPAGAFWLGHALGYAPSAPAGTRMHYRAMTPTLQCVEDVSSAYYNRIVDRALVTPDWEGTDRLRRSDGLYEFLVFVNQNVDPAPVPGRGSCILLHVWTDTMSPTAGCTSMDRANLEDVVRTLEPEGSMLVQLPAPAYDALAEAWGLPAAS